MRFLNKINPVKYNINHRFKKSNKLMYVFNLRWLTLVTIAIKYIKWGILK